MVSALRAQPMTGSRYPRFARFARSFPGFEGAAFFDPLVGTAGHVDGVITGPTERLGHPRRASADGADHVNGLVIGHFLDVVVQLIHRDQGHTRQSFFDPLLMSAY